MNPLFDVIIWTKLMFSASLATRKAEFSEVQWVIGIPSRTKTARMVSRKADKSQTMPKLVAASWLAPRVKSSTMVPSGSSGDNSRSAVKSGVVPVRINNRPTFLGASAPKWRGGLIGIFFMSKPMVFGSQIPWPRVMNLAHLGALDAALPCPSHPIAVPLRSGCNWSSCSSCDPLSFPNSFDLGKTWVKWIGATKNSIASIAA